MAETIVAPEVQSETTEKRATPYNVVLLNDEDHTYSYVIEMLQKLFYLTQAQAYAHAVEVDFTGRTVVFTGSLEEAQFAQSQIHSYGADPLLPQSRGSMSAVIEPAEPAGA